MPAEPSQRRPRPAGRVLSVHLLLSLIGLAAGIAGHYWLNHQLTRLPAGRAAALPSQTIANSQRDAISRGSREVQDAVVIQAAGLQLGLIDRPSADRARIEGEIARLAARLTTTGVGRLHQACARLAVLDRSGQPVGTWWPAVQPYLAGLERSGFEHHQATLKQALAAAAQRAGLPPAMSLEYAESGLGETQGPFMQSLTRRLQRLIVERTASGDAASATAIRAILVRWLRQWTLDPGSIGLRLTAAQLLSETLGDAPGSEAQSQAAAAAANWRQRYRAAARAAPPVLFGIVTGPSMVPGAEKSVLSSIVRVGFVIGAALGFAAVALTLSGQVWRVGAAVPRSVLIVSSAVLVAIAAGGYAVGSGRSDFGYDGVQAKFIRMTGGMSGASGPAHGKWHSAYQRWMPPIFGGATAIAAVLIGAGLMRLALRAGAAVAGRAAGVASALCGALVLLSVPMIGGAIARLDEQRAAALAAGAAAHWIGPQAENLLQPVRDLVP